MDLNRLRRDRGQYLPLPSVEEALAYPYTESRARLDRAQPLTAVRRQPGDGDGEAASR